jgi:hypothetical protein
MWRGDSKPGKYLWGENGQIKERNYTPKMFFSNLFQTIITKVPK